VRVHTGRIRDRWAGGGRRLRQPHLPRASLFAAFHRKNAGRRLTSSEVAAFIAVYNLRRALPAALTPARAVAHGYERRWRIVADYATLTWRAIS